MNTKLEKLGAFLKSKQRVAVALSGGLDSSVLLAVAAKALGGGNCIALTARTPYTMAEEIADAAALCRNLGVAHIEISRSEIPEDILFNPPDRCYLCKRAIFSDFKAAAEKRGFDTLCDGTNADDLSDYRPGMRALRELSVVSPFLECGLGKPDIREIARGFGMSVADKPAYACLLTRLVHGEKIDVQTLSKIDAFESFLRGGFAKAVRARVEAGNVRIECAPADFPKILDGAERICAFAQLLGFKHCSLDLAGYKRGSMNVVQ